MGQHSHDVDDTRVAPFWTVQAIYDLDGGGSDFAYTTGLAERGHPELHIWARPPDGTDPGEDWKFSQRDCCFLLNEFGGLLVRGRLSVGDVVERTYDGGMARVVFTVGPPVDPDEVDAFGVAPGAPVLPIRWRLEREPEAEPTAATDEASCRAQLATLLAGIPASAKSVAGWRRPSPRASFALRQPFGPLTPLVRAQGIAITAAAPLQLADFCTRVVDAEQVMGPRSVLAQTRAAARRVGRVSFVDAANAAAEQIVTHVRGPGGRSPRWQEVLDVTGLSRGETLEVRTGLSGLFLDGTAALLTLQAVADVATDDLRLAASGPWSAATSPSGMVAGDEWLASAPVLATARHLVCALRPSLAEPLAVAWLRGREECGQLAMRLRGLAVTSPAGSPAASRLLSGTAVGDVLAVRSDIDALVTEWLCCLTAALSNRAHLDAADVRRFCAVTHALLPTLHDALDTPVVVEPVR